ncbi:hypothetical protein ALC57_00303 [Trachymyrmex cornetzi]|uniref:Uncharacterized protein n=1 Tax=Trachymyrmex cornetzi TaxID=471704 RepID=A0A151JSL5_9HYME|nr:hypothetical protein ALC57_00303 [Trachymyrmex cornetzi]
MQCSTEIRYSTSLQIESRHTNFKVQIDCLVLPTITERLPQVKLNKENIKLPDDARIADPSFNKPGKIDLLIGAGLFWKLLCVGQIQGGRGNPTWQKTLLGWVIGGEMVHANPNKASTSLITTNQALQEQIERFWKQEDIQEPRLLSKQEGYCEEHFINTYSRESDGRFIVSLPKDSQIALGDSRETAMKRLLALERRFKRQPALKEEYVRFMEEYKDKRHMSTASGDVASSKKPSYFIPHQPVLRPESTSTKLRVVFDASAKTDNGKSLNDMLLPGPNLQNNLSYLGMTVHWINPETLERESAALACRRIKGKHTYDVLAQAINSVFLEYHIQNKVCGTTYMLPLFRDKCKIMYTDTNSLIYRVECEDIYETMKRDIARFDTSDYPTDNAYGMPLANKKKPGLMKDKNNGAIMTEFVGLRAKMYAVRVDGKKDTKKAKGVKSNVVAQTITFDDYTRCLNEEIEMTRRQSCIRSKLYEVYAISESKIALSPYDDKRYVVSDSTETLPWRHWRIPL